MMHFGKRLNALKSPSVIEAQVLEPLGQFDKEVREAEAARLEQERELESLKRFPFSLYFDLPQDRVLEPVLEGEY